MFAPRVDKPSNPRGTARAIQPLRAQLPAPKQGVQRQQDRAALGRLLTPPLPAAVQAKLKVGAVDDPLEHEADRVAEAVLRMPADTLAIGSSPPQISRKCAQCEESVQRAAPSAKTAEVSEAPASVDAALRSTSEPLDAATRAYFEPRFGNDFSAVRIHTGGLAQQAARAINASAFTVGRDIVFGAGAFSPRTRSGRQLLAHELTHVVQQGGAAGPILRRAPANQAEQTERSPFPEEGEVLLTAARALRAGSLNEGSTFYKSKYWQALAIGADAFIVGPFSSDMGPFYYVYRSEKSDSSGSRTFSRGTWSGGWGKGAITAEAREQIAKVRGSKQLEVQGAQLTQNPRGDLAFMISVWGAQGRLDPARMPQGVGKIPPLPVTKDQAQQLHTQINGPVGLAMLGTVATTLVRSSSTPAAITGATQAGVGAAGATLARGTAQIPAVTEEAAAAALEAEGGGAVAVGTGRLATAARVGTAAAAFITIITYEDASREAGNSLTTLSEITGGPFGGRERYDWERRLTPRQRRYLKDLWNQPSPVGPVPAEPIPQPQPDTPPKVDKDKTAARPKVPGPTVDTDEDQRRRRQETCATKFPNVVTCDRLPAFYNVSGRNCFNAAGVGKARLQKNETIPLTLGNQQAADTGPCVGQGGQHFNVMRGKFYLGAIVCCPCCSDTPQGPDSSCRCGFIRKVGTDRKPEPFPP